MVEFKVATITEAKRKVNEAFDSALVIISLPNPDEPETFEKYKLDMVNNPFLLNTIFAFTNTKSGNVSDLIGKTIKVFMKEFSFALANDDESKVFINRHNEIFTMDEAIEMLKNL